MVIDRTTGKGCALSIAAKTVTRNLIADGIIGKTIAKKERPKRSVWLRVRDYGDDWVCIGGNIAHELTEEPLWVPSFIDERIWTQAVSKFHIDSRLDENVVEFLLPEMDEYLQNIPDSELISITRDFLIENGILDQPIRRHKGNTYYFDKSEIYSLDNESKLFPYEGRINHIFTVTGPDAAFFNSGVWIKAAPRFEVGMSLKECIGIFVETELAHRTPQKLSPLDSLYTAALYGAEEHPDYFGAFPVPSFTPRGFTVRHKTILNGVYWLETDRCEEMLAVCYPIWKSDISIPEQNQGEQLEYDRMYGIDNTLGYLFFSKQNSVIPLHELSLFYPEIKESSVVDMDALLNAICEFYPEYVTIHNEEEAKFEHGRFIKETPGVGTEFIKF